MLKQPGQFSLRSEICRTLRVGCTHARTIKNHHNAFPLGLPGTYYGDKINENMYLLTLQGNALLWSQLFMGGCSETQILGPQIVD